MNPPNSSADTIETEPKGRFYFDLLSMDSIENATRLLSSKPNARAWSRGIPTQDISSLYGIKGAFGTFFASGFNAICVSWYDNPLRDGEDNEKVVGSNDILMAAGENVKKIHWVDDGDDEEVILGDFPINNKIESFSLGECNGAPWIIVFGQRMKALAFHAGTTPGTTQFVANHCTNLYELTLKHICASCEIEDSSLWAKIGGNLEVLEMKLRYGGGRELWKIEHYCRKLKHISITSM